MKIPMTKKGYEALQTELSRLKREDRPKNIQAITEAREHGDLKENAEYKAAKEQQQFINNRMTEVEHKLANAQVVEISIGTTETVVFGVTGLLLAGVALLAGLVPSRRAATADPLATLNAE